MFCFSKRGRLLSPPFLCPPDPTGRLEDLVSEGAFRLVQVFLEIGHEGRAAGSDCAGVARMDLVLAMDVTVGVSNMDVAKLRQQIDARAVGIPKIGLV